MKVLLMVQNVDERPRYAGRMRHGDGARACMHNLSGGAPGWWGGYHSLNAQRRADRWWLVEAESAEAARVLIGLDAMKAYGRLLDEIRPPGRILASGGRDA